MQIYLVGGAVRDTLLNRTVEERDWVVVGETPESMVRQGFRPVGKDFPVFLHPQTFEEYALARTERKVAHGYKGFSVYTAPELTLEDDLIRRDLTINAMAMTPDGHLIDPYGGRQDLQQRVLRHVSPAFVEDPVRILRVARFAARYHALGFKVAEETIELMQEMVANGEVDALVPERVWAELVKALAEAMPSEFFYTLQDCGALAKIFPELDNLFGVPQPAQYHPEIDTGIHTMMALQQAVGLSAKSEVRFAVLVHDLGKAATPKEIWPSHRGHEKAGVPILENLCVRLRIPNSFKKLALHVMLHHTHCHKALDLRPGTLVDTLVSLGALKHPRHLQDFLLACEADARGRSGFEERDYPQASLFWDAAGAANQIDIGGVTASGLQGAQVGEAIRQLRIKAVCNVLVNYRS